MKRFFKIIFLTGLFAAVAVAASTANAQVYQWKEPPSRTTRFSNTAPPWYGNIQRESHAPRVQVFYYGVLVDDTDLAYGVRLAMRAQSPIGRYLPRLTPPDTQQARR